MKNETGSIELLREDDRDIPSFEAEKIPRWTALLVPLLAAAVAFPGLGNHLLSDDFALLYSNVGQTLGDVFSPLFQQSTSRAAGGSYRPLTEISIGLDYMLWGTTAFGFHLENLLWHMLNSIMVLALVRVLVPPRPVVALTAGLLFAVHPVHGDAIFWLSARSDLLVTFFYLATLILFVRGRGHEQRRRATLLSVLSFVLALLAKEVALSLPFMVVILDLAAPSIEGFRTRARRHLVPRYMPYVGVAMAYLGLRLTVLPTIGQARFPGVADALYNLFLYFKLLVLPMETHTGLRGVVVAYLVIIVVVVMFLRYARMGDRRNLLLGVGWMITVLLPIVDVPRRWQLYLPSVGFCIFFSIVLAGLVWRRDEDHPRLVSRVFGVGLLALLGGGAALLGYHATVYGRAGKLAQTVVAQVRALEPTPPNHGVLRAVNLPSVLTSWAGDQPIFAFGFSDALKLAYGRDDIQGRLLSTVYVRDGETARPRAWFQRDRGLHCLTGGGAYAFSFHSPKFTTGRDKARRGQKIALPGRTVLLQRVTRGGDITEMVVTPTRPIKRVMAWTGDTVRWLHWGPPWGPGGRRGGLHRPHTPGSWGPVRHRPPAAGPRWRYFSVHATRGARRSPR